jgi:hypothetical protein
MIKSIADITGYPVGQYFPNKSIFVMEKYAHLLLKLFHQALDFYLDYVWARIYI